ncbi:hypothetical protein Rcae01_03510 [Novipirellula caenicola]|uniref:Uncharacterized protein n=1 Tax=Novipirellula caenicola TaxID=1536901 RepID=A0ABP9VSA9_9BACT
MLDFRSGAIANYRTFRNNLGKLATGGLAGSVDEIELRVSMMFVTQVSRRIRPGKPSA